jgi:hypothetical protein
MEGYVHLLYVSRAAVGMTDDKLRKICDAGLRNNEPKGVFGVLLYRDGMFLQLLEGPNSAVESTFERIKQDPMHTDIRVIYRGPCVAPLYTHYNMGVITEDDLDDEHKGMIVSMTDHAIEIAHRPTGSDVDAVLTQIIRRFAEFDQAA